MLFGFDKFFIFQDILATNTVQFIQPFNIREHLQIRNQFLRQFVHKRILME